MNPICGCPDLKQVLFLPNENMLLLFWDDDSISTHPTSGHHYKFYSKDQFFTVMVKSDNRVIDNGAASESMNDKK